MMFNYHVGIFVGRVADRRRCFATTCTYGMARETLLAMKATWVF